MGRFLSRLLDRVEEHFCAISLLAVTAVLFTNVVLRYVFRLGFVWSEEFVRYLMIWIAFVGISMATRRGHRLAVDLILHYTPPGVTRVINITVDLLCAFFGVALLYYGYQTVESMRMTVQVSPGMGLPMYVPYLVIPLSGALLTLRFLQSAVANWRSPAAPEDPAPERSGK